MAKKKNNSFLPKLAMVVVFVLAVIYTVYHLISLFADDEVKTIVSGVTTHSVTVGGTGYVIVLMALMVFCVVTLAKGGYNPFIYFNF